MNNYSNQDKAITEEDIWRDELQVESPDPVEYPALYNISSGFIFQFQAIPKLVKSPEYVYIPERLYLTRRWTEVDVFVSKWNISWESAQARQHFSPNHGQTIDFTGIITVFKNLILNGPFYNVLIYLA